MKCCPACAVCFDSETWVCPRCGFRPAEVGGIVRFSAEPSMGAGGFNPDSFARLAELEEVNFWFRGRNRLIQWALKKYFPKAENFLEIGCGTGFVLKGLQDSIAPISLAGSELFGDGLLFAKARLPGVALFQMDARQIPFAEEFSVIGAFDVLEHIAGDGCVLDEMFRATRSGGGVMITVPQHRFLWSASDEHAKHQRRYSRAELSSKVRKAGFVVERITSFVSLILPLMVWSRMTSKNSLEANPWREFEINRPLNATLEHLLAIERALIRAGVSFPAGGSLLLVAKKPPTAS